MRSKLFWDLTQRRTVVPTFQYNLSVPSSGAKQLNKGLTNTFQPLGYKKNLHTDFWLGNPMER